MTHWPQRISTLTLAATLLGACTTTRVDEEKISQATVSGDEAVVVLGRRHSSDYDTEPGFISCIGDGVGSTGAHIVPELEFLNGFYPWFEPRTAPMSMQRLDVLMQNRDFAERMDAMKVRYIIWIDGKTETTDKSGSISCAIGPGGAGCIGFGRWDRKSTYEANVWDIQRHQSIARISTQSDGTSYMPALIVPIPLIARVQAAACDGLSSQLQKLFTPTQ